MQPADAGVGGAGAGAGAGAGTGADSADAPASAPVPASVVRVAVLVPFRDTDPRQNRAAQLREWVARVPPVFDAAWGPGAWTALVIEQAPEDGHRFSRGRLLNAGAWCAVSRWPTLTTLVLHDVDLCMDEARAAAACHPPLSTGEVRALNWDSAQYGGCAMYVGGVCALTPATFFAANGFWNAFEGWGGEDDCLRDALQAQFKTAFALVQPAAGRVVDVGMVPYRCAEDPEAKLDKATRKGIKAAAARAGYAGDGVRQLVFRTVPSRASWKPVTTAVPCILKMTADVFPPTPLPEGWHMSMSRMRGVPFYVHTARALATYDYPTPEADGP